MPKKGKPKRAAYTRGEIDYDSLDALPSDAKGKRITIFINGDIIRHGIQMTLPKFMKKWELLIRDICNATGQHIATMYTARGKRIRSVEDVVHGHIYVAAGHEPFKMLSYAHGSNIGTDRSAHDIHKAGFRKNEKDYVGRMKRLWYANKAVELDVYTMNSLVAPAHFILGVKDLLSFTSFLRRVSMALNLPHGNGAVRSVLDLSGREVHDCKDLHDGFTYLALGSFKGPKMQPKQVKHRLRELNGMWQVTRNMERRPPPKRPPIFLTPEAKPLDPNSWDSFRGSPTRLSPDKMGGGHHLDRGMGNSSPMRGSPEPPAPGQQLADTRYLITPPSGLEDFDRRLSFDSPGGGAAAFPDNSSARFPSGSSTRSSSSDAFPGSPVTLPSIGSSSQKQKGSPSRSSKRGSRRRKSKQGSSSDPSPGKRTSRGGMSFAPSSEEASRIQDAGRRSKANINPGGFGGIAEGDEDEGARAGAEEGFAAAQSPMPPSNGGFGGDVASRVSDLMSLMPTILALEKPAQQRMIWSRLKVKTETEAPLHHAVFLLRGDFPLIDGPPALINAVYSATTGRLEGGAAVLYRTELAAFVVRMYFWKLLLTAYLEDMERLKEGAPLLDMSVGFDDVWRGLTALQTRSTLTEAAASFEVLVQKHGNGSQHNVPLGAVGDWYATSLCPKGMEVALDTFTHGGVRTEISTFSDQVHALLGDATQMDWLWSGQPSTATRRAIDIVEQLVEALPQLPGKDYPKLLAGRAYARLKNCAPDPATGRAGDNYNGKLGFEDLEPFVAVVCYLHTLTMVFPVVGANAAQIDYTQFLHIVGCLSLSRPSAELLSVFDSMTSNTRMASTSRVAFDEVCSWYTSMRLPRYASQIWGAANDALAAETEAASKVQVVYLEGIGEKLAKKERKERLKRYDAAEKVLYETVNTDDGAHRVFDAIDDNGNSILSMEELHTFFTGKPYEIDDGHALIRALKVGTGKISTMSDITSAQASSSFTGNAWASRREFPQVLCLSLYFAKVHEMLGLRVDPTKESLLDAVQLNMTFPSFQKFGKLLGLTVLGKKVKAQEIFDELRVQRGNGSIKAKAGWDPEAVTLEDVVLWHAKIQCPDAFKSMLGMSGGSGGGGGGGNGSKGLKKKQSKKVRAKMVGQVAEAKLARFKDLIAMEGKITALAANSPDVDSLWQMLDVHSNGTVALADFQSIVLKERFAALDQPDVLRQCFVSTTGREYAATAWFEQCEFLPLLVNCYYFHKLDHEMAEDGAPGVNPTSRFAPGQPMVTLTEIQQCLTSLGLMIAPMELEHELAMLDTKKMAMGDFCLWYAKRKCPDAVAIKPLASPFDTEELALETMALDSSKVRQFFLAAQQARAGSAVLNATDLSEDLKKKYPGIHWPAGCMQQALARGAGKGGKLLDDGNGGVRSIGDVNVELESCAMYLIFLLYFKKLYQVYGLTGQEAESRRLTFVDFKATVRKAGMRISEEAAAKEFTALSKKAQTETKAAGLARFDDAVEVIARARLSSSNL